MNQWLLLKKGVGVSIEPEISYVLDTDHVLVEITLLQELIVAEVHSYVTNILIYSVKYLAGVAREQPRDALFESEISPAQAK